MGNKCIAINTTDEAIAKLDKEENEPKEEELKREDPADMAVARRILGANSQGYSDNNN